MQAEEAKILLGIAPDSCPDPSQVKTAYRKKVWECHPDLFPADQKVNAESRFKLISEAHACLLSGTRGDYSRSGVYSKVVRTGVPRTNGGRGNRWLIGTPFFLIVLGTVGLGGFKAIRAYKQQKTSIPVPQSLPSLKGQFAM